MKKLSRDQKNYLGLFAIGAAVGALVGLSNDLGYKTGVGKCQDYIDDQIESFKQNNPEI